MNRVRCLCSVVAVLILATGCSGAEDVSQQNEQIDNNQGALDQNAEPKQNPDKEKELSQTEVLAEIKKQIDIYIPITLPEKLPLNKSDHLSATTQSETNMYTVQFFVGPEPTPINNQALKNGSSDAKPLARLTVHKYDTQKKADEEIAFQDFSQVGGQELDLGHNIIGYQDAGAGSLWTSWNEGRWALTSHTQTSRPVDGEQLARDTVEYLEKHTLPIPKQHGYVHVDATGTNNRILWQKESTVYTLDQVDDPMIALKIAVMFK
ncbi:hypothetical protein [Bacillus sp. NEB1478]|uniref:hypothetical protein n=1 Tax=Bacillus sp. NEB1478 TaxID=3073816 RepID=UPI0028738A2C|nr:hypothetical protein [Bacillus sp. NEB1478]WNB90899.1 hypothetical protein RGB74_13375 [Bacillus sp. NEB1478]